MYAVSQRSHSQYGEVIEIQRQEHATHQLPSFAVNQAITLKRLAQERGVRAIRFLIDDQIFNTSNQLLKWSHEEYQSLPKCAWCHQILGGEIYPSRLSNQQLFCSSDCCDQGFEAEVAKMNEEEEFELL